MKAETIARWGSIDGSAPPTEPLPTWLDRLYHDRVTLRRLGLSPAAVILGRTQRAWCDAERAASEWGCAAGETVTDAALLDRLWGMPIVDATEADVALLLVAPNGRAVYRRDDGRQVLIHEFRIEMCPTCGQQFVP